jgi:predicted tellurium resistance membrane protein TerC
VTVPAWAWAAFAAFVLAMLALDLFVLHRSAREVALKEAAAWSVIWVAIGLGFGGLLWLYRGGGTAQAYLAGYLIEKSLSSNVFALLGMRALYFLLAGAAGRFRYLQPGLAIILAAVAVKLLLADVYGAPVWTSPAFITVVLGVAIGLSLRDDRRRRETRRPSRQRAHQAGAAPVVLTVEKASPERPAASPPVR